MPPGGSRRRLRRDQSRRGAAHCHHVRVITRQLSLNQVKWGSRSRCSARWPGPAGKLGSAHSRMLSNSMLIGEWFKADEIATDDLGWTANLAIFRVVFLAVAVLPFAYAVLQWIEL